MSLEFTPDQIVAGITSALHEGDVTVVPGLIRLLAVKDPHRAQAVLDTIELGIAMSRTAEGEQP